MKEELVYLRVDIAKERAISGARPATIPGCAIASPTIRSASGVTHRRMKPFSALST